MGEVETGNWRAELAAARRAIGLSQEELASLASVARGTIQGIEQGRRDPSRQLLIGLVDVLKLERAARLSILRGAGFVPDTADPAASYWFTLEEAAAEAEERPWPVCVVSELMEVMAANRLLQRLWGVDLDRELNSRVERNILSVISMPRFQGRLLNRDECVSIALGIIKGHHLGAEASPLGSSPYFQAVIKHFMAGDQALVARLFDLWATAQPRPYKTRGAIPVRWRDPDAGDLRFEMLLNSASEPAGLAFQDWIPIDSRTWDALEIIRKRESRGASGRKGATV